MTEPTTAKQREMLAVTGNDTERRLVADIKRLTKERDELHDKLGRKVVAAMYEPRSWSVVIRALDSWHEINLQDSKCSCPAHKRVEVLRKELVELEALATGEA